MRVGVAAVFAAVALAFMPGWQNTSLAQQPDEPMQADQQSIPIQPEPASAAPGEEIMQPTRHGVRFTRRMAEGFGRMMVNEEFGEGFSLDDEQREQLAGILTERAWDLKLKHAPEGAQAFEYFYENLISREIARKKDAITPDEAREFSRKVGPGVRLVREFWESLRHDARPILSDEQYAKLDEKTEDILKMTSRFEADMERWSRGEVKEGESFIDALHRADNDEEGVKGGKSREYRQAERSAGWRINRLGPEQWRMFLRQVSRKLEYDDAQKKAGEDILSRYTEQAKAVMTDEWREKALANQVQRQLQWMARDEPLEPWLYHLDVEYRDLVKPLMDMGRSFRSEVLGLARPEQRDLLLADLRKVATDSGMSEADADMQFLAVLAQPVETVAVPEAQATDDGAQGDIRVRSAGEGETEPDVRAR